MGVTIWTTTQCNMQCAYCYEARTGQKKQEDVLTDCEAIVHWLEKTHLGKDSIQFHGGEPLLNFELINKLITMLDWKGILPGRIEFTTNGTIMNKKIEEFIQKYAERMTICVSLDGTKKMHDAYRKTNINESTYEKVIETVHRLNKNKKLILRARMTVTPDTVGDLYQNVKHLVSLGFHQISASLDSYDLRWNEKSMCTLKKEIIQLITFWKEHTEYDLPFVYDILNRRPRGRCTLSYNIYTNGRIYPCMAVTGMMGYEIGSIYNGVDKQKIQQICTDLHKDYEQCRGCENKKYCIVNRCKFINESINKKKEPVPLDCRLEALKLEMEPELALYMHYK